jgi:streptomycin 3"-adenylyltransferase
MDDIVKAIQESLPTLLANTKGDERNIILTLARMWFTMENGEIVSKDMAAEWAIPLLPKRYASLLDLAKRAYLGECADHWEGMEYEVAEMTHYLKKLILY